MSLPGRTHAQASVTMRTGWVRQRIRRDPSVSYLLVGAERTGSTLCCTVLCATRRLGWPEEYFNPSIEGVWAACWGVPAPGPGPDAYRDFVEAALRAGTTRNGVYGGNLFASHTEHLLGRLGLATGDEAWAPGLASIFPSLAIVHLERRDKVAAAVSHWRAMRTAQWSERGLRRSAVPPADLEPGAVTLFHQAQHDAAHRWARVRRDLGGLHLLYEDIADDPAQVAGLVADLVGVPRPPAKPGWLSRLYLPRRQRDARTARFIDEWVEATGGCAECGHGDGPSPAG